ncbi:uncharacterized protein LOC144462332, partial [Epinephelus lanceolatus]
MYNYFRVKSTQRSGIQNGSSSTHTHTHTYTPTPTRTSKPSTTPQPLMSLFTQSPTHRPPISTQQHSIHTPVLTHPPDPETRQASKQYFKLIQALHHKHIMDTALATGTFPPGMLRQVTRLTDFIKPSTPTIETRNRIYENTTQWMQNTISILQQHYTATIDTIDTSSHNPLALQIATGWARKRYGSRLTTNTLQAVQQLLQPTHTTTTTTQPELYPNHRQRQPASNTLPTIQEEEYPHLPKSTTPSTLSLYLGPRKSIAEEIQEHHPITPTQPQQATAETQTTPQPKDNTNPQPTPIPLLSPHPVYQKTNIAASYNNSKPIRRGPIKTPRTTTIIALPPKKQLNPENTPPAPITSTPQTTKTRRVTWGPLPTTEDTNHTTSHTPISPILPPTPPITKTPKPPAPIQTIAQVYQPTSQPHNQIELHTVTLSTHSNVSVHITDTILPSSPYADADEARVSQAGQCAPPTDKKTTKHPRESANMMIGLNKVDHDPNITSSEPSPQKPVVGGHTGLISPGTKASPTLHALTTAPIINHLPPPHHTSPPLPPPSNPLKPTQPSSSPFSSPTLPPPTHPTLTYPFPSPLPSPRSPPQSASASQLDLQESLTTDLSTPLRSNSPSLLSLIQEPETSPTTSSPPHPTSTATTPTSPDLTLHRPNYHIARPTRKIQDWFFKAKKPVLIIGDSNINRIPGHTHFNIQLDSYPGANTYHFLKVCEKALPNPHVKILVISIGINNKDQDPKQTSIKQLKALFRQVPGPELPPQPTPPPPISPHLNPLPDPLPYPNQLQSPTPNPNIFPYPNQGSNPLPPPFPNPNHAPHLSPYPNQGLNPPSNPNPDPQPTPSPNPNHPSPPIPNPNPLDGGGSNPPQKHSHTHTTTHSSPSTPHL